MTSNPDDIRREIEQTRRDLSDDVNALHEKVSPTRVVGRRVERAKGTWTSAKETVMGRAQQTRDSGSASGATGALSSAATTVAEKTSAAPGLAVRQTQGNPLAAGLIAFGAGWLVSSILPATDREQQLAQEAKDKAVEHSGPVKARLSEAATEVKQDLEQPAREAVGSVEETARDAATIVREDASSAKDDVTAGAHRSRDELLRAQSDRPL